jgi:hypothetical protein
MLAYTEEGTVCALTGHPEREERRDEDQVKHRENTGEWRICGDLGVWAAEGGGCGGDPEKRESAEGSGGCGQCDGQPDLGGEDVVVVFVFDPETQSLKNLGKAAKASGEVYSMGSYEGKLYLCSYPGKKQNKEKYI